jgi:putative membrane protein
MNTWVRENVPAVTGLLTVVSLALVFGAVLGAFPPLPRAPDTVLEAIPTANALISAVAIGTIVTGWRAIRRGNVRRHRRLMLTSLALFVTFLALYLYRVSLVGTTSFGGPEVVYRFVFLPFLAIHMLLAIVCIPLLYYAVLIGLTHPVGRIRETRHRQVGRIAAPLWLVSFSMGIAVWAMLYVLF